MVRISGTSEGGKSEIKDKLKKKKKKKKIIKANNPTVQLD